MEHFASFYLDQAEPQKSCLLTLRDIIMASHPHISETRKYGMPCFCYGKKAFCYLWVDKKTQEPYILMVEGKHLNHPALETGKRARMKIFRLDPAGNLPFNIIGEILAEALSFYEKE